MNTKTITHQRLLLAALVGLSLIFSTPPVAWAAAITVSTTDDELNTDGDCSLREAVAAANGDVATDACPAGNGADSITLPAGTYGFTTAGELLITEDLSIVGAGRGATVIDANGLSRAVYVQLSQVSISHLTIREGNAGYSAGSNVYVGASSYLTLVSVRITAVPAGASLPETFQTPSPTRILPKPCSMGSTSVNTWPTYCAPRRFSVGAGSSSGLAFL